MRTSTFYYIAGDDLIVNKSSQVVTFNPKGARGLKGSSVDTDLLTAGLAAYARRDGHVRIGKDTCAGHLTKASGGRFSFEVATAGAWSLVKNSVVNGLLIECAGTGYSVQQVILVDHNPELSKSGDGDANMELRKNKDGSPIVRPQVMGRFLKSVNMTPSTADDAAASADDERAANLRRVKQLARYLSVDPQDTETLTEMRTLLQLLAGDGKEIDPVDTGAKEPQALFDHAARTAGMNPLEKKQAADLAFRKALTASVRHPHRIMRVRGAVVSV